MNPFAYRTTGFAIKALSALSRANIVVHGRRNIPQGAVIYVINHFTRIETLLLPARIFEITKQPVWSLADYALFEGHLNSVLTAIGAVSTKDPHRDLLIVKTLLTGEASWIIYPEGRMVKNKKLLQRGRFMISAADKKHPPHTGAANLALRTEFYRQRLRKMLERKPEEARRLADLFGIEDIEKTLGLETFIVPVNMTYYPLRAEENLLTMLAAKLKGDLSPRAVEEIMTEGTMLLSGVDVDMRFGPPIAVRQCLRTRPVSADIQSTVPFDFDDKIASIPVLRRKAHDLMQTYMAAIYRMTAVNPDHLLASLIVLSPSSQIDITLLKQRLFLAATESVPGSGVYRHSSLRKKQTHLLTDDRYGRFGGFVSLLAEKGILEIREDMLVFEKDAPSATVGFHRIRVDNPLAVIVNEIEPLIKLRKRLRRVARLPAWRVRRRLAGHLLKAAQQELDNDYAAFFVDGESRDKVLSRPILVRARRRHTGVLLLHGYLADPREMAQLARFLGDRGYWVYVPRIRGHGTSPVDLASRDHMEWIESVEEGYILLSNICRCIVVGGFSNGASLALDLATRVDDLAGVFAVSPPFKLQDFAAKFVPAMDVWNRLMEKIHLEEARKDFVDNTPENPHINYHRNPVSGIRELERLVDSLQKNLARVQVPAMIIQSHRDPVVDERGSKHIFDTLGSEDKRYLLFNFPRHGILLGEGAPKVHRAIAAFIEQL